MVRRQKNTEKVKVVPFEIKMPSRIKDHLDEVVSKYDREFPGVTLDASKLIRFILHTGCRQCPSELVLTRKPNKDHIVRVYLRITEDMKTDLTHLADCFCIDVSMLSYLIIEGGLNSFEEGIIEARNKKAQTVNNQSIVEGV